MYSLLSRLSIFLSLQCMHLQISVLSWDQWKQVYNHKTLSVIFIYGSLKNKLILTLTIRNKLNFDDSVFYFMYLAKPTPLLRPLASLSIRVEMT